MSAENSPQGTVEYVGGKPVEQSVGAEPSVSNENRDAANEAVKKAIAKAKGTSPKPEVSSAPKDSPKASEKEKKEAEASDTDQEPDREVHSEKKPKAESKEKEESSESADEDGLSLKRVLKQKEKLARQKQEQSESFRREQEQIQQRAYQLQQYEAQLKQEAQRLERLRNNPAEAIREAGWDPEDLILSLANQGTPEGKQQMLIRQQQEQLRQLQEFQENQIRQQQQAARQAQQMQAVQYRQSIEQRFLGKAMAEDKPLTQMFYKGREAALIAEGDIIAAQYRHLSNGREATPEQIADYIEENLASYLEPVYEYVGKTRKASVKEDVEAEDNTEAVEVEEAKPKAKKVGKTLGSESTERRALSKKIEDLDDDERKEEAKRAVKLILSKQRRAEQLD